MQVIVQKIVSCSTPESLMPRISISLISTILSHRESIKFIYEIENKYEFFPPNIPVCTGELFDNLLRSWFLLDTNLSPYETYYQIYMMS